MSNAQTTKRSDPRQVCGERIAILATLRRDGATWLVPSESRNGLHRVDPVAGPCTCPDHAMRKARCKHLCGVKVTVQQETTRREVVTSTGCKTVTTTTRTVKTARVTYRQDWTE